jgi:hypothetical protein
VKIINQGNVSDYLEQFLRELEEKNESNDKRSDQRSDNQHPVPFSDDPGQPGASREPNAD